MEKAHCYNKYNKINLINLVNLLDKLYDAVSLLDHNDYNIGRNIDYLYQLNNTDIIMDNNPIEINQRMKDLKFFIEFILHLYTKINNLGSNNIKFKCGFQQDKDRIAMHLTITKGLFIVNMIILPCGINLYYDKKYKGKNIKNFTKERDMNKYPYLNYIEYNKHSYDGIIDYILQTIDTINIRNKL